ncbi:MAG TPA: hypothetical protein VE263_19380 [Candidatus Angelobacter sp.]|nr:hypothetical protein [Candidatus Angelobacter sp.]
MKNKMRAMILVVALASFGTSPAWAQQPAAKDAKACNGCCGHHDSTDKKDAMHPSGTGDCCQNMDKQGKACCDSKETKTVAGKEAKADCCKDAKADCCKDGKDCCSGQGAKLCQTKEGKGCCGEKANCSAKAAAK